jgi:rhodanese-related sulfurtransferase
MTHTTPNLQRSFALLFLIVAAAVWLLAVGAKQTETPRYAVPEVSVDHAKEMIDAGALVIDVRGQAVSEYRHIPGALLIPLAVLRTGIPGSLAAHKDQRIVVYCGDGVHIGPEATHLLRQAGYAHAVNMTLGYSGWIDAKLPVVKS